VGLQCNLLVIGIQSCLRSDDNSGTPLIGELAGRDSGLVGTCDSSGPLVGDIREIDEWRADKSIPLYRHRTVNHDLKARPTPHVTWEAAPKLLNEDSDAHRQCKSTN
jgi:hypothetical protein